MHSVVQLAACYLAWCYTPAASVATIERLFIAIYVPTVHVLLVLV